MTSFIEIMREIAAQPLGGQDPAAAKAYFTATLEALRDWIEAANDLETRLVDLLDEIGQFEARTEGNSES